jgi:hypothetical protein
LRLLLVVEKPRRLEGWGCVGTPRKEEWGWKSRPTTACAGLAESLVMSDFILRPHSHSRILHWLGKALAAAWQEVLRYKQRSVRTLTETQQRLMGYERWQCKQKEVMAFEKWSQLVLIRVGFERERVQGSAINWLMVQYHGGEFQSRHRHGGAGFHFRWTLFQIWNRQKNQWGCF